MNAAIAVPGNTAKTFLVHDFDSGLEGDDRFVVERLKALADGNIRPVRPEAPGAAPFPGSVCAPSTPSPSSLPGGTGRS